MIQTNWVGFYNTAMALIATYCILGQLACGVLAMVFLVNGIRCAMDESKN